jgi:hypothetical protein
MLQDRWLITETTCYGGSARVCYVRAQKRQWPDISTLRRGANGLSSLAMKSPNKRWQRSKKAAFVPDLRVKAANGGMAALEASSVGRPASS